MSEAFITFLASFLLWFMFGGLFVLWIIDGRVKKEQVIHTLISVLLALILANTIKAFVPSIRPFYINGKPALTLIVHNSNSFPSSHTAVAFALAVAMFLHEKKLGKAFLLIAALVAVGRVLANVHYTVDVIVGGLIGVLVAIVVDKYHLFGLLKK